MTEKPRLGPWLRSYERSASTPEDRWTERLLAAGVGLVGLVGLIALVWLFVRAPWHVLAALVGIWGVSLIVLVLKRRRARLREHLLHKGHSLGEVERAIRDMRRRKRADD